MTLGTYGSILNKEMVVLVLIHDEGNLGGSSRALELKRTGRDANAVISHEPRDHIRTCLRILFIELGIFTRRSWLVERSVAVLRRLAGLDLIRINHIERVGIAIVGEADGRIQIPEIWIVFGLRFTEWRDPRTEVAVLIAEG